MTQLTINEAKDKLTNGQVIAYPTEAVFGLGCDPDDEQAVLQLLTLKNRSIDKGLILIAHQFELLLPYIDLSSVNDKQKKTMLDSWPAPITWIVPKNKNTPYYLTGQFDSIAIRVSDQKIVEQLCKAFGKPLVSTSANLSGLAPCLTVDEVESQFGNDFPVVSGQVGGYLNPSEIRDLKTGQIIRHG